MGARCVHGVGLRFGNHRRGARAGRRAAPRPVRHAAVLRLQHGRLFCPLAFLCATHRSRQTAEDLFRELVPQGRGRQMALARLWRKQPGAQMDLRTRRRHGPGAKNPHRQPARPPTRWMFPAWTCPPPTSSNCWRWTFAGWKKEADDVAANYARFGSHLPKALNEQLDGLRQRLG